MHDTAYRIGEIFFQAYVKSGDRILDIGSMNVNGTLRAFQPGGCCYVGIDLESGAGVDVVVNRISQLPFRSNTFDAIVTTSCFEHDSMFWVTFLEMCRVVKPAGYIYINAPSRGWLHQYPIDAWRFFPDAGIALRDWAKASRFDIDLVESFLTKNMDDMWNDCVMVFSKGGRPPPSLVCDRYDLAVNVRKWPDVSALQQRQNEWY